MFSGIVETTGRVKIIKKDSALCEMTITPDMPFEDLKIGDSVAVNGVCLTITKIFARSFNVEIVPQSLRITNLGELDNGDLVNLERSLQYNARISGHLVQGHVDFVGTIIKIELDGDNAIIAHISIDEKHRKYIIDKGYISLDGMSITVINANSNYISVTFIPHTKKSTIAKNYMVGSKINIELDMLGKYIEKILGKENE